MIGGDGQGKAWVLETWFEGVGTGEHGYYSRETMTPFTSSGLVRVSVYGRISLTSSISQSNNL